MPITASFTGFIPALEYIVSSEDGSKAYFSLWQLFLWSTGLCFFGIVFASLMRKRLVEKGRLPWPGAKAVSQMLLTIHSKPNDGNQPQAPASRTVDGLDVINNVPAMAVAKSDFHWQAKMMVRSGIISGILV
jgi:uncharacterized oligopeptide transporter (OPT) family protein